MAEPVTAAELADALHELTFKVKVLVLTDNEKLPDLRRTVDCARQLLEIYSAQEAESIENSLSTREAALEIWMDLADRRGFGLGSLRWDNEDTFKEIIDSIAKIIERAGGAL